VGAFFKGSDSDVARMTIVGILSETQTGIHRALWEAQQRMIKRGRPGARAGELVEAFGEGCQRHGLPLSGRGLAIIP